MLLTVLASVALAAPVAVPSQPPWTAPLPQPVRVVRGFDPPAARWSAGHRGVDLTAPIRSTVSAAGAGRISYAARLAGRGVVVVVHGDLRTTYEPVTASVKVGQLVATGEPIGFLDKGHDPARAASGVLHWGLLRGETYLDPMSLLPTRRPVRLLPHWQADTTFPSTAAPGAGTGRGASPSADRGETATATTRSSRPSGRPR